MRAALLALALAGCVTAETAPVVVEPDGGPGYPPKMGDVSGTLGDRPVAWETFDFSIGAFDASAWVGHFDGPHKLHIGGYTPGDPKSQVDRLTVSGNFPGLPAPGSLRDVEVTIGEGVWSVGQSAAMTVERIEVPEGSGYGSASGTITATFCPSNPAILAPCRLFQARFSTKVQFNG
jgi:hypothetical protein